MSLLIIIPGTPAAASTPAPDEDTVWTPEERPTTWIPEERDE